MSVIVNDSIQSNSPKSLDNKYLKNGIAAYANIADANTTIIPAYRSIGLTVLIGSQEYWYSGGVADNNLVLKSTASSIPWGNITGTLSNQVDLSNALNQREPAITAGTITQYWRGDKSWQTLQSDAVTEGSTNLYFTNARARQAISAGTGITYNSTTGVIAVTAGAGQLQSDWNQSNNTQPDYIKNKPSIPVAQVNSDWTAVSGVAQILNKPTIPAQFNPIAGANISLSGTYPNITFTAASGSGSGCIKFAWIVGGPSNFATIPGSPTPPVAGATTLVDTNLQNNDVRVSYNGFWIMGLDKGNGELHYTKSSLASNTVTFSQPMVNGDEIIVETLIPTSGAGSGGVTSIGLTMPSAFTVSSSPVTTSGNIVVTGAGTTAQYVRGDGSLATFPTITSGTVTSVALTVPSGLTVTGSPITASGTLSIATALNGPVKGTGSGFTAGPINLSTEVTGNLPVSRLNSGSNATGASYWRGDGVWATPPVSSPGGANGNVQFNLSGTFGGDANLFWDNTNKRLGVGNSLPGAPVHITASGGTTPVTNNLYVNNTSSTSIAAIGIGNDTGVQGYLGILGSASTVGTIPPNYLALVSTNPAYGISLALALGEQMRISPNGVSFNGLAGSGIRMVTCDSTGRLIPQAITAGTVTSVAVTVPAAFTVSGSPITGAGTIAITAAGTSSQYIRGDGTLATLPAGTGTVTSVAATISGSAITIAGSPITSAGTISLTWAGTSAQYVAGNGGLVAFPSIPAQVNLTAGSGVNITGSYPNLTISSPTVTSVGLTMPAAFTVSGSPVTSSGTLAVTAAGTISQYIRGDGSLATFPAQVNADWNATSGTAQILNKPTLTNIYNSDGTLTGTRVVTLNGNELTFQGSNSGNGVFVSNADLVVGGRPSQNRIVLVNAASAFSFSIGRSINGDNAQDFFIYDHASAATRLTINSTGKVTVPNTLQILDGTQGAGKVFTSDASGNGSWQTSTAGNATSSSFTPFLTPISGISQANIGPVQVTRINNTVTVTGSIALTISGTSGYAVGMTIPTTSIVSSSSVVGVGTNINNLLPAYVSWQDSTHVMLVGNAPTSGQNISVYFMYTYVTN